VDRRLICISARPKALCVDILCSEGPAWLRCDDESLRHALNPLITGSTLPLVAGMFAIHINELERLSGVVKLGWEAAKRFTFPRAKTRSQAIAMLLNETVVAFCRRHALR
jgi:hypothetical protein